MSTTFRLADHAVCRQTNGELRMLFDRSKGVMYELNESASAVVELLRQAPASSSELCDRLRQDFEAGAEDIRLDVERMMADFVDAGLVIELDAGEVAPCP